MLEPRSIFHAPLHTDYTCRQHCARTTSSSKHNFHNPAIQQSERKNGMRNSITHLSLHPIPLFVLICRPYLLPCLQKLHRQWVSHAHDIIHHSTGTREIVFCPPGTLCKNGKSSVCSK